VQKTGQSAKKERLLSSVVVSSGSIVVVSSGSIVVVSSGLSVVESSEKSPKVFTTLTSPRQWLQNPTPTLRERHPQDTMPSDCLQS